MDKIDNGDRFFIATDDKFGKPQYLVIRRNFKWISNPFTASRHDTRAAKYRVSTLPFGNARMVLVDEAIKEYNKSI